MSDVPLSGTQGGPRALERHDAWARESARAREIDGLIGERRNGHPLVARCTVGLVSLVGVSM